MKLKQVSVCLLLTLCGVVQAQQERVYWGTALGNGRLDNDHLNKQQSYAQSRGWSNIHAWSDEDTGAFKIFRGVVNDRYWATEVGVAFLGESTWTTQAYLNGASRRQEARESMQAFYVDKIRYWGGSDQWRVFGRAGLALTNIELEERVYVDGGPDVYRDENERKIQPKLGVGFQYRLNNDWHIRAETERYLGVDFGVSSLGVVKLF